MMAAPGPIAACVLVALVLWGVPGFVLARAFGRQPGLRLLVAPALGWAGQTTLAHALAVGLGLSGGVALAAAALLCLPAVWPAVRPAMGRTDPSAGRRAAGFPSRWRVALAALACAAALALIPTVALLPKPAADGAVHLATPIYDHAKIALVDEMVRAPQIPPANPFYGAEGSTGRVSYYYLWHFGTAQLARLTGASGWEADAAATFFTAFAALALVAGLALRLSPGTAAPLLALAAAATGSVRPVMAALIGPARLDRMLEQASGLGPLLFQASWSPHHVASAASVVLAILLLARMRCRAGPGSAALLALLVASAFGSSLWVGGVTLAVAAGPVAAVLIAGGPAQGRWRFLLAATGAGLAAAVLSLPILAAQAATAMARGGGVPIRLMPVSVLGQAVPDTLRALLDPAAYWLVLLPVEFPLALTAGLAGLAALLRARGANAMVGALAMLAAVSLGVGALLVSTAGDNNDLGWRAVLPAVLVLSACAGGALAQALGRRHPAAAVALMLAFAAGVPDTAALATRNIGGLAGPDGAAFRNDPQMWARVRGALPPETRLAANPDRLAHLASWPINLSWALLARGRSCFAGRELALAFAPLTPEARNDVADLFERVFAGRPAAGDLERMHGPLGCGAVLVTAEDGAFAADPFAQSPLYRLRDEVPGRWRLYRAR
ncbi:hypothetical protein V5F49_13115 [Xanthobacter sp. V3C-3]|uniref:hypothetical protein n=1 Tax=Xanthobacter lutulentifluminis TaxID=3119935 RepID=UPI00372ABE9A